jgi:leader peptidase (prepilin peptidase) / N-methyltransferase
LDLAFECALFVVGLAFGSFLNVCISRIPRDQSIVSPRSHCPVCGAVLRWRDNVPLLSSLLLRCRCRDCGARISLRYPAVELLTALLFTACYVSFGPALVTVKLCVFCFLLVGLIFMDAETGLLPREFTYPGILLGLALSWIAPTDSTGTQFFLRAYGARLPAFAQLALLDSVIGALVGAGFFYLAWALYYLIRKRHGMGFGDIALMAMVGAFLGLKLTLFVIFSAPLAGAVYAALLFVRHIRNAPETDGDPDEQAHSSAREMFLTQDLPFGVFLGACALGAVFYGKSIWRWYLNFF